MIDYYTDEEVAALLGITLKRLRNKLHAQQPLPPRIQPPGCRKRLWPKKEVNDWFDNYLIRYEEESQQRKFGYYK